MSKGQILVISGPSGSGKSSLIDRLIKDHNNIYFSVSSTTREIREGEEEGINYHYISKDKFEEGIEKGEFLEWAIVHKNYYGTSLVPVQKALQEGKTAIFDIDVQGFKIVKEKFKNAIVSIFITTKSRSELKTRLELRGTDSKDDIERRILNAAGEMEHIKEYDYLIINDDFDESYAAFESIFKSVEYKTINLNLRGIIDDWIN
ncbi:guanylate kinase [Campylobacter corcagiensis]|uniref:Guanylate kinase n=1 Tax=Campylobacter corcagiensis TaxID=1448857 RepID=A0A7M1LHN4_9BACT|nr:guanylate kinase [Campylobacter corcagiensis]QKF64256.1 deoxyguanylate kinase / guanylate kinase [Campylobacter corcagiensis]QOQ87554.1 guanylate kinase [Campylobacter corcagiensis]